MEFMYRVYDVVADKWNDPYVANNDEHAKRKFRMDMKRMMRDLDPKIAEDFDLWLVGECNSDGSIYGYEELKRVEDVLGVEDAV